jgi:hypothetical protein
MRPQVEQLKEGLSAADALKQLQHMGFRDVSEVQVKKIVKMLFEEGRLYGTTDDPFKFVRVTAGTSSA